MDKPAPIRPGLDRRLVNARTISPPASHEGVGNALRAAFEPGPGMPDDFAELLNRVDR